MVQNDIERRPIDYFISWHDYYFDDLLENLKEEEKWLVYNMDSS